jgi:hypothetical protein
MTSPPGLTAVKDDPDAVAFERELVRLMRESPVVELAPQAGLAAVMARIERRETRRRLWAWPWRHAAGPTALRPLALAIGVQAIVIVMLTGVLWVKLGPSATPQTYRTLSTPAARPDTGVGATALRTRVRVVLADDMTLGALRTVLSPWSARIVDGPSARGIYTVEVEGEAASILSALRSTPGVLLAEPVSLP